MGIGNIATTGMQAAMSKMEIISNNIANVGTSAYKSSTINFADIYPSGGSSNQPGLGVRVASVQQNFAPGAPIPTSNPSDLSISNNGFFVMRDASSGTTSYSRYGKFEFSEGYLTIGNQRLQGFPASNGTVPPGSAPTDLFIDTSSIPAKASTKVSQQQLNLNSGSITPSQSPLDPTNNATYNFSSQSSVYDSLGNSHDLTLYYIKTSSNNWTVTAYVDNASVGTGSLTFSGSGQLTTSSGLTGLSFSPTTGANSPQSFDVDMTGATQIAGTSTASEFKTDGYQAGNYKGFTIDANGLITVDYSNRQQIVAGQVALATFQSPEGLQNIGNMSWVATTNSGVANVSQENSQHAFQSSSLEMSNVNLAQEMVDLITAQSIFQANAQVQQTYTQVMQTVTQL